MSLPTAHVVLHADKHLALYADDAITNEIVRFKPWQPRPQRSHKFYTVNGQRYALKWTKP